MQNKNKGRAFYVYQPWHYLTTIARNKIPLLLLFVVALSGCFGSSDFSADPIIASDKGVGATLNWNVVPNPAVQGTTTASISPDIGPVSNNGSIDVFPDETTEYTLHIKVVTDGGLALNSSLKETVYIGPTINAIEYNDANLAQCMADQGPLFSEEFEFINCVSRDISNIEALSQFPNLTVINIDQNSISDLTPLSELTKLHTLNMGGNEIESLEPLADMQSLRNLNLGNNAISDLQPLSSLDRLFSLGIYNNQIEDLSPLSGLSNLQALVANRNLISDVSQLTDLPNLKTLNLADNQIVDVEPVSQFTGLIALNLANNQIESGVLSLKSLTQASLLALDGNPNISCLDYLQLLIDVPVVTITSCQLTLSNGIQLQLSTEELLSMESLLQ